MSEQINDQPVAVSVIVALSRVMADVQAVGKDGNFNGGGVGYKFRGVDAVVNAVGPALRQHGVVVLPVVEQVTYREATTSGGKAARGCEVRVSYIVYGPAGDRLPEPVVVIAESLDNSDKGTAKAMSVAYRTLWLQLLCIPTDDPDPDENRPTLGKQRQASSGSGPAFETDSDWLAGMRERIDEAKNSADLRALWKKAADGVKAGQSTEADKVGLHRRITDRQGALSSQAAPVTAQRKSAQPAPDAGGWPVVAQPAASANGGSGS